jgi:hypothetical protein
MYAWIWRHLPFGLWGRLSGSLLLVGGVAALLWFVIFPWMDPWLEEALLPFDDSQLEVPGGDTVDPNNPAGDPAVPAPGPSEGGEPLVGPDGEVLEDPNDIPYETGE